MFCQVSHGNCINETEVEVNNKLRLDDLNDDVLLELLHRFTFLELLNLAHINCRIRDLITRYIIPKFRFNEQTIQIYKSNYDHNITHLDGQRFKGYINIHYKGLTLKILRSFGSVFSRIFVDH